MAKLFIGGSGAGRHILASIIWRRLTNRVDAICVRVNANDGSEFSR